MAEIKRCPDCGATEQMQVGGETAFVEFSDDPEGTEPEHAAVYYFNCCRVAVAEVRWKDAG